jgi:ABC-type nitrate/sulfonate/bicarbonate transport system ATPase subunit
MTPYELKEVLVQITGVHLSLGGPPILKELNAVVRNIVRPGCIQGQIVGILGPSGIGKTQLSRILSGLQSPASGSVLVSDAASGRMVPVRPGLVGVVAQNYPLFRHRTVLGNLLVSASRSGSPRSSMARSLEKLSIFGLEDKKDVYPAQLSGGQRQRVAIAQQMLCSERFLIMDEPFSGLDPLMKDKTCELISRVSCLDEANTVFVVSHDIQAVTSIADSLWLIGRERDPSGHPIPGSSIRFQYDLAAMGMAWRPGLSETPEFASLCAEIKARFSNL